VTARLGRTTRQRGEGKGQRPGRGERSAGGGWEGEEERYFPLYHIGNPNPRIGFGNILIDQVN
jgi:hypothetical protein